MECEEINFVFVFGSRQTQTEREARHQTEQTEQAEQTGRECRKNIASEGAQLSNPDKERGFLFSFFSSRSVLVLVRADQSVKSTTHTNGGEMSFLSLCFSLSEASDVVFVVCTLVFLVLPVT